MPAFVSTFTGLAPPDRHIALSKRARPLAVRLRPRRSYIPLVCSTAPTPDTPPPTSLPTTPQARFTVIRTFVFLCMSLLYSTYVLLRGTFTYAAPTLASTLSLPLSAIGQISSAFPVAYGTSRLFTGALVDRTRPHLALCLGLLLAGLANTAMGFAATVPVLAALWGLNGLVQGVGAGASAKLLTSWFPREQRGFYWALWSTSANVGAFAAPLACAALAPRGFRTAMVVPGLAAAALALALAPVMRSSPAEAGLVARWADSANHDKNGVDKASWRDAFVQGVLKNRVIWGLAVAYFFVYLVRSGMKSWLHFWLLESRGLSAADAAYRASGMEVGGILGTFSAGIVSDAAGGRRVVVTMAYLTGLFGALLAAWAVPAAAGIAWDCAVVSVLGFMINGPQMMIGLIGAEASEKRVVATATGVLGWISYLGAASSGFPLSVVIRRFGWGGMFATLVGSTVISVLCLVPFWKLRADGGK